MSRKTIFLVIGVLLYACATGRADFKYTQTSQVTGGALASMMKGLGVFSKSARQATKPTETTTYIKGNYLRQDNEDGSYQIIDLDGRRFIEVYPDHKSYSVITFDQMRQAMEQMEQQLKQKQAEAKNSANGGQNPQVTVTPKIQISATGKTQSILGQETQEMLMKLDLEMQSTDAQHGTQSGTMSLETDEWLAPSVIGYHEVSDFYKKMAVEVNWAPHTFGMDPRMTKSLVEMNKSGKIPVGLPMMTTVSMLMPPGQGNQSNQANQQQQQQENQQNGSSGIGDAMNPSGAAVKALGGMFARHRKKKQEEDQEAGGPQAAPPPPNSLMTITSHVTSFSTDSLDSALFQIPSGFTQVQANLNRVAEGGRQ